MRADIKEFEKTIEKMKKTKDEAEEKAKKVSEIKGRMEDEFSKELKELNNQAPGLKILAKYAQKRALKKAEDIQIEYENKVKKIKKKIEKKKKKD